MTRMLKVALVALVLPTVLIGAQVRAAAGQFIEGGDILRTENVTKAQTTFVDPNTADSGDTILYKVRIHNPGPDNSLNNVTVQAVFPTGTPTKNVASIVVRAENANEVSDTATVNLSSAVALTYVPGSTQLLDQNGNVMQTLPDTITGAGVNIGTVGISINEKRFVQFKMTSQKPGTPTTPQTPATAPLATAGPEDAAAGLLSLSGLGIGTYALRRSRQKLNETLLKK